MWQIAARIGCTRPLLVTLDTWAQESRCLLASCVWFCITILLTACRQCEKRRAAGCAGGCAVRAARGAVHAAAASAAVPGAAARRHDTRGLDDVITLCRLQRRRAFGPAGAALWPNQRPEKQTQSAGAHRSGSSAKSTYARGSRCREHSFTGAAVSCTRQNGIRCRRIRTCLPHDGSLHAALLSRGRRACPTSNVIAHSALT